MTPDYTKALPATPPAPAPADWRKTWGPLISAVAGAILTAVLLRLGLPAPTTPLPVPGLTPQAAPLVIVVGGPAAPGVTYPAGK